MVECRKDCEGASNSRNGTPPRCLYLEESSDEGGVVVIGLNPGHAAREELEHYRTEGMGYDSTVSYLKQKQERIKYYSRIRAMLKRMRLGGSILWTEVAKCELLCGFTSVPFEMQRRCTSLYLREELQVCEYWPVVATGRNAFVLASLVAVGRTVLGVPHPTGSWGKAFDQSTGNASDGISSKQLARIQQALSRKEALWLDPA